ncbi:MAG: hypothetical protein ACRELV_03895 [Longimicrobiales bacterium]
MSGSIAGATIAAAVMLTACAGSAHVDAGNAAVTGEARMDAGLAVEVRNDLIPPTSLTVWLVRDTGGRNLVGTVTPRETRTFSVEQIVQAGQYRLVAETTDGTDLVSREFFAGAGDFVSWRLTTNTIDVSGP